MQKIDLQDYYISVGTCADALSGFLEEKAYSRIFILMDENTEAHCLPRLKSVRLPDAGYIRIPSGEAHKHIDTCAVIWRALMDAGADRNALLLNLGGGVIGDMGGFCASTYKRGIDFVQIPTTLLSQVDASIGGKLGIDFNQVKNSIGVFGNPRAVLIDTAFLQSLSSRERRSGFAEIIKHALIVDAAQWDMLKQMESLETVPDETIVIASIQIKKAVVEQDPLEKGLRKALNFGHTIGHAVESVALESTTPLLHGEAIAVGMICEAFLSFQKGYLSKADLDEISERLVHWYQPQRLDEKAFDTYFALMQNDKKNEGGGINFSLIGSPGTVHINQYFASEAIANSLNYFNDVVAPFQK